MVTPVIEIPDVETALTDGPAPPGAPPTASEPPPTAGEPGAAAGEPGAAAEDLRELSDGELQFQRCRWCRTAVFRRLLCPVCASSDFDRERSGGTGVVRHATIVGRSTGAPRAVALIAMDEGYRLRATVTVTGTPLDAIHTGARVRLSLDDTHASGELAFRLSDGPYAARPSTVWR